MDIKKLIYSLKTLKSVLIFKRFLVSILINSFTGSIIRFFKGKELTFKDTKIDISNHDISNLQVAALFFSHYESKEVLFLNKYLNIALPCIELGSSLGIVSCQIAKKNQNLKIFVEANPKLLNAIENNLKINKFDNYKIVNAAISYDEKGYIEFEVSKDNLVGRVNQDGKANETVRAKCLTLKELIDEHEISAYSLVMDIEGAEYELILNEKSALKNCKQIIAEFHDFEYQGKQISFKELEELYVKCGFKVIDSYYNRYVFEQK